MKKRLFGRSDFYWWLYDRDLEFLTDWRFWIVELVCVIIGAIVGILIELVVR